MYFSKYNSQRFKSAKVKYRNNIFKTDGVHAMISTLGRCRLENQEFKHSLGYIMPCLKQTPEKSPKQCITALAEAQIS